MKLNSEWAKEEAEGLLCQLAAENDKEKKIYLLAKALKNANMDGWFQGINEKSREVEERTTSHTQETHHITRRTSQVKNRILVSEDKYKAVYRCSVCDIIWEEPTLMGINQMGRVKI